MILDVARLLFFPALMAFAAASDLFTMTISNRVSLALAAGFLVLAFVSGMSVPDILMHLAAGATVLVVAFACFAFGWVGGGDAKVAAGAALPEFVCASAGTCTRANATVAASAARPCQPIIVFTIVFFPLHPKVRGRRIVH